LKGYFGLRAFTRILKRKTVKWLFDSQSCLLIIQPDRSKPDLHKEAMAITLCFDHDIDLRVEWILREFNKTADRKSKMANTEEWEVTQ